MTDRFMQYLNNRLGNPPRSPSESLSSSSLSSPTSNNNNNPPSGQSSLNSSFNSSQFSPNEYISPIPPSLPSPIHKPRRLHKLLPTTCSICLTEDIHNYAKLPCNHNFCLECLLPWLEKSSKCPNCRKEINKYFHNGLHHSVEPTHYEMEPEEPEEEESIDWQCYNCDETNEGDIVLICDDCEAYACHPECDEDIGRRKIREDELWFCHFCRVERRARRGRR